MKLFASLYLFAKIALVLAAPVADVEVKPDDDSPKKLDGGILDLLVLPGDVDMNHSILNSTHIQSLDHNDGKLEPPTEDVSSTSHSHYSFMTNFHDILSCKRNDAFNSAIADDIKASVQSLHDKQNTWCCQQNRGFSCTNVTRYKTSIVQICGKQNVCIDCRYIAAAAIEVVNRCPGPRSFGTAKGYKL